MTLYVHYFKINKCIIPFIAVLAARNDTEEFVGEDVAVVVVGGEVRTILIPGLDATGVDCTVGSCCCCCCCWCCCPTTGVAVGKMADADIPLAMVAVAVGSSTAPCFFSTLCFRYSDLLGRRRQVIFVRSQSADGMCHLAFR